MMSSIFTSMGRFLDRYPGARKFFRWLRFQIKKVPGLAKLSIAFDKKYFSYVGDERPYEEHGTNKDDYFESYARILSKEVHGRVLDLGCGYGYLTERYALNPEVASVLAIDKINDFRRRHLKIEYLSRDLAKEKDLPGKFDVISTSEFIEHLTEEDFLNLLPRIGGALREGGIYIGSTPRNPTKYKTFSGSRYHLREYNEKELTAILERYFRRVKVRPVSDYCMVWEAEGVK